jgi:hypothetical protein
MTAREQLHAYIAQLEQRLRWSTVLRGFAILTGGALAATLVLVTIANALAFSHGSVTAVRFALILILAIAAAAGLALPLRRLTRRRAVGTAEATFPQFQQRLTTFSERDGHDPFIELLAGDTLGIAQSAEPRQMVTDRRLWISLGAGVGAFAILLWMIAAGPGFLGYGASLLWTGPHRDKPALYDLRVTPGDAVVRRHADQLVSALPTGLRAPSVKVHARFQSSSKWEEIAMQPKAFGSFAGGYEFLFAGLPENVEYYVTAGAMTSKHFNIRVTDLTSPPTVPFRAASSNSTAVSRSNSLVARITSITPPSKWIAMASIMSPALSRASLFESARIFSSRPAKLTRLRFRWRVPATTTTPAPSKK